MQYATKLHRWARCCASKSRLCFLFCMSLSSMSSVFPFHSYLHVAPLALLAAGYRSHLILCTVVLIYWEGATRVRWSSH